MKRTDELYYLMNNNPDITDASTIIRCVFARDGTKFNMYLKTQIESNQMR